MQIKKSLLLLSCLEGKHGAAGGEFSVLQAAFSFF